MTTAVSDKIQVITTGFSTAVVKVTTAIIEVTIIKFELKAIVGVVESLDIVNKTAGFEVLVEHGSQPQRVNNLVLKVSHLIVLNLEIVVNVEALHVVGRRLRDGMAIDGAQTTARMPVVTTMETFAILQG